MLEIGSLVDGKYKVLNKIGSGGMSVVYLALNERANKTWAIKEVRKNGATKDDIVKQGLIAETDILKKLNHPHLPSIIDVIDVEDSILIVMDYVEGIDLDKRLRNGPQPWQEVVGWGKQLCDVLAYLHSRKPPIIYRDMKPGNVMLKPDGNVVLLDFGTAREYKSQKAGDDTTCLGTKGYAAPEQYGGMGQTDARTDIYCLGATMYHLVTGLNPSAPPYEIQPIRRVNPALPEGLERIIIKCTQQNPDNRYQDCTELMYDLEHINQNTKKYMDTLRRKVRLWEGCIALSLILGIVGGILNFNAGRTSTAAYEQAIAAAFSSLDISDESVNGNAEAEKHLSDAIAIDPSNPKAWLYLSKVYRSDHVITSEEYTTMDTMLKSGSQGNAFQKNSSGYSRFCMEWGLDLYFFYSSSSTVDGTVASGSPTKSVEFFSTVVGDGNKKEQQCINLLVNEQEDNLERANYAIRTVDKAEAEDEYQLASQLLGIGRQWEVLGNGSAFEESYGYSDYWKDLKSLMDSDLVLGSDQRIGNVEGAYIQCALYSNIMSVIYSKLADFHRAGVSQTEARELVTTIQGQTSELQSSGQDLTEEQDLLNNINTMADLVLNEKLPSMM